VYNSPLILQCQKCRDQSRKRYYENLHMEDIWKKEKRRPKTHTETGEITTEN
jgi:uncharacterized protein with von Willebrand factor type A (vWA) domain